MSGSRSAVILPVPEVEALVAGHRMRHDRSAPIGVPAHLTVNFPFVPPEAIDADARSRLAAICRALEPFELSFPRVGQFEDAIYLAPEPPDPVSALIDEVAAAFPDCPPYGGAFDEVIPHVTIGDHIGAETIGRLAAAVEPGLPVTARIGEAWLMAESGDDRWETLAVLPFGPSVEADVARDGSPVGLYRRIPDYGEPALIHRSIPEGAGILELGSGTGRMTHRLVGYGHPVTAVDNSAGMLAHVRGAEAIHAEIEALALGRRFAVVLLASHLINSLDAERAAFVATCARHVAANGAVLIQRYDPAWADDPKPGTSERHGVRISILDPRRDGPMLTATVEYQIGDSTWRHGPFTSRILDDVELDAALGEAGLHRDRWLDDRRSWVLARPEA